MKSLFIAIKIVRHDVNFNLSTDICGASSVVGVKTIK